MPITIKTANMKYKDSQGQYVPVNAVGDDFDIQINGTSIVDDGVANIPVASSSALGTVKVNYGGLQMDSSGYIRTLAADASEVKAGTAQYSPIVPQRQHNAAFYGLAKAAGDTTQSQSDNAVGTYTTEAKAAIQSMLGVPGDVQVNGTSVVSNGVANVPMAYYDRPGVLKVGYSDSGLNYDSSGYLKTSPAGSTYIKSGSEIYRPVAPLKQHESVFYGLAKLAGADMASLSGETIGVYPEAQKIAIQKMLGIYVPPFELIRDITLSERTSVDITVDSNGLPFSLLSIYVEILYAANLESETSGYGRYMFYDSNNNVVQVELTRYATNSSGTYKTIYIEKIGNAAIAHFVRQSTTGDAGPWRVKSLTSNGACFNIGNIVRIAMNTSDYEPSGTKIKIYAQRAY